MRSRKPSCSSISWSAPASARSTRSCCASSTRKRIGSETRTDAKRDPGRHVVSRRVTSSMLQTSGSTTWTSGHGLTMATLRDHVGSELGVSRWLLVDQQRIDQFAECTEDHQWIHVDVERAKRESPFQGADRARLSLAFPGRLAFPRRRRRTARCRRRIQLWAGESPLSGARRRGRARQAEGRSRERRGEGERAVARQDAQYPGNRE